MIQIKTVGNELFSSLSLFARQSMLMFTELPGIVIQCLSDFSSLNIVKAETHKRLKRVTRVQCS